MIWGIIEMTSAPTSQISALPTKTFFVEMFTKDIALEQAVLDLVDNSVDGAKRYAKAGDTPYAGFQVNLTFNNEEFLIADNCGGFSSDVAVNYAFRFGRPKGATSTPGSIGQFGVGMKRALFKFGRHFIVQSATPDEEWAVEVPVTDWENNDNDWHFPWGKFAPVGGLSKASPGTEIQVTKLRPSVSAVFATKNFENSIVSLIRSKHRSFIGQGMSICVNGTAVLPIDLVMISGEGFRPASKTLTFDEGGAPVTVRILAGVGASQPSLAGWYVICNGRIILEADRRAVTGWGVVEDAASKTSIPGFHNQFARFRGIVTFDSTDSARVPWNTTKTDVDQDNVVWRAAREEMIILMRPVIDFLNELDADIEENTRERSPLYKYVEARPLVRFESIEANSLFEAPEREELAPVEKWVKVQYSRKEDEIDTLKTALKVNSARAVGERTFDLTLKRFI